MSRAGAPALAVAALLLAAAVPARAAPRTLTMSGQPVTQALVADLAYFYRHRVPDAPRFALSGGGTDAGIADTVRGISDAALVSRPLAPGDPPGLVLTPLAISAICLVSNRSNPLPAISRATLQDIVSARVSAWSAVPGAGRGDPIVPVALASTSGGARVFESVFLDLGTPILWRAVTLLTNAQVRDYIAQTPAAFGYVDLALTGPLHVIAYEGVPCTRRTVGSGAYPARRPLGVVTRGRPRGALRRFLHWARTSRTARHVITVHYLPASRGLSIAE